MSDHIEFDMNAFEEPAKPVVHRWCRCSHVEGAHFAMIVDASLPDLHIHRTRTEPYQCHVTFCRCRAFTEDRRLWSKIKRKIGVK